jgi:hypothetical protein
MSQRVNHVRGIRTCKLQIHRYKTVGSNWQQIANQRYTKILLRHLFTLCPYLEQFVSYS